MKINPKKLQGDWKAGFALDVHTLRSDYLGDDEYGHPQFDNTRSQVGELLFRLKYRSDKTVIKVLAQTAANFVKSRNWSVDIVIPVPPSQSRRAWQPVPMLAKAVGRQLGIPSCLDCVVKVKETAQLKNVYDLEERSKILKDAYVISAPDIAEKRLLVLDDLYRSGATLTAVVQSLKTQGNPASVHVLTLTKTRSRR